MKPPKLFNQKTTPSQAAEEASGLGTFGGVFTPSILTILGVIMYLRFGWVVGNVGVWGAMIIVTLATSITFLTSLSICAIATDRVVRAGGAYYMISRSLGIETGGAVGIPLYFAQALSVALYTIGFAESVVQIFPRLPQLYIALGITAFIGFLAYTSAEIAIKAQYFIMAAIAISLVSFVLGHRVESVPIEQLKPEEAASFWQVFAVFFPAVTGIMAGVNMSGDLKNPTRAIPIGTLAAVGTGYVIYMIIPLFLARWADPETLIANKFVMREMALWGPAIIAGVWGATLSSALGSILGAPRVLQALARDGVLPHWLKFLGNGSGPEDEPRIGTAVTLGVAVAAVCLNKLELIAPVLSMFFLTTYFVLNVSATIEGFLQSPSFRPSFQVPWFLSLLGAVGCLAVMFLINPIATIVAAIIVLIIYLWLQQREIFATWGDARRGIWMALLREGLYQIDHAEDPKNWRPHVLVLSGAPQRRWSLIHLAEAITHNRGLVTVASVLTSGTVDFARKNKMEVQIRDYLERNGVQALVRLVTASNPFEGAENLVDTYGLGPLVPNTIVLGDSEEPTHREAFCRLIAHIYRSKRNLIILRDTSEMKEITSFGRRRCIDVWWGGLQGNGSLMLLLAYLLRLDRDWGNAKIYVKLVVPDHNGAIAAEQNLTQLIKKLRIGAIPQVIEAQGRSFSEIVHSSSQTADLVFLGMAAPGEDFQSYYDALQTRTAGLPTTAFVLAAPDFAFEEVLAKD